MKTPDKVWLIDVGDCICWYDEPNPYGMDDVQKPDAVEYVRADSLARLKAEWQAEGAQLTADSIRYKYEGEIHQDRIADHADEVAEQLRRQAEEATLAGRKG